MTVHETFVGSHVLFLHVQNCCLLMGTNTVYCREHKQGFFALWHNNFSYISLNLLKSVIQIETFQLLIMKEWELARNNQKIRASILGASYKRGERAFMYWWLLFVDVNLFFPLAISFFNSKVKATFWQEIYILPFIKPNANQSSPSLVAFPFCLSMSGSIFTGAALVASWSGCATQEYLVVFFPGSADFLSSGSRAHGVRCQGIAFTSLCWAFQGLLISQMNATTQPCFASKQTTSDDHNLA